LSTSLGVDYNLPRPGSACEGCDFSDILLEE
jgi:hypothetical protein